MIRHQVALAVLAAVSAMTPIAAAAQSGQAMGQTCFVCHGPGGRSEGAVAPIAGLPKEHVARQMADFKADRRPGTIMNRIAKGYTDEQIALIVEYLAALK
jgi:sulfide dehydrogenase cytochrome subunit